MLRSACQQRDSFGASIIFLEQHERRVLSIAQVFKDMFGRNEWENLV